LHTQSTIRQRSKCYHIVYSHVILFSPTVVYDNCLSQSSMCFLLSISMHTHIHFSSIFQALQHPLSARDLIFSYLVPTIIVFPKDPSFFVLSIVMHTYIHYSSMTQALPHPLSTLTLFSPHLSTAVVFLNDPSVFCRHAHIYTLSIYHRSVTTSPIHTQDLILYHGCLPHLAFYIYDPTTFFVHTCAQIHPLLFINDLSITTYLIHTALYSLQRLSIQLPFSF
jgi:hypothetical protein